MNLRSLRERKLFSQERLAEISGLSLRTIQRLEAGHRVSYASLRSLAATLEIDVDLLERELYAYERRRAKAHKNRHLKLLFAMRWSTILYIQPVKDLLRGSHARRTFEQC
jgi:transcriptional regulator with XRE-family HTH domain